MLRIIAGTARGRRLKTPEGQITRPTSERVREALFNIIAPRVMDSVFLDLFAGSGAVGLEALSRGAKEVVFVENNRKALACLTENLSVTGFRAKGHVIATDVRRALTRLIRQKRTFDLIFADPPYNRGWGEPVLVGGELLAVPGGLIILESPVAENPPDVKGIFLISRRIYGDTALNIYQKAGRESDGSTDHN